MSLLDAAAKRRQDEIDAGGRPHDGYTMVEAMRPDLKPGESITYVPDRYCQKCQQPRGIKKCSICGRETVLREDLGEVVLPDLPAGASLDLPLAGNTAEPVPGLPAETLARPVLDATPPPDPEIDALLARDASVSESERPKLGSMLTRAMAEREAAERAEATVIEQAKERSRLLNHAAERQAQAAAKPPLPAFMRPAAATGASILDLAHHRPNGSPRASGRSSMQTTTRERVLDEGGREQQRTPGKGSRRKTVEDELLTLWEEAKIQKEHWVAFAAAYARSGLEPGEAADAADSLYMELIKREQLARR